MAIKPPNFKRDAIPTPAGWRHPRTNELLKAQRISQGDIDAYLGVKKPTPKPTPKPTVDMDKVMEEAEMENEIQQLNEAPTNNKALDEMNKLELEAIGRQHGVELDRRESRTSLYKKVKNLLG